MSYDDDYEAEAFTESRRMLQEYVRLRDDDRIIAAVFEECVACGVDTLCLWPVEHPVVCTGCLRG